MIKLKNLRLWWPEWNAEIPFKLLRGSSVGNGGEDMPDSYRFWFDRELAEFSDASNGMRLPISTAKLINIQTHEEIPFTLLYIIDNNKVQINRLIYEGYTNEIYNIEDLAFTGYMYDPADDTD